MNERVANDVVNQAEDIQLLDLVSRIRASKAFQKSPSLSRLFTYLLEQSLSGRQDLLSEQQIGIAVFGRPAGYNAAEDSIVRVQVHKLRQKLDEYFTGEGSSERVRIIIPKGQYRVSLQTRVEGQPPVRPAFPPIGASLSKLALSRLALQFVVLAAAFLLGFGVQQVRTQSERVASTLPSRSSAPNPILAAVFSPPLRTMVVVEDTMLILANYLQHRPYRLAEYLRPGFAPDFSAVFRTYAAQQRTEYLMNVGRYVNLPNLNFAVSLLRDYPRLGQYAVFRHPRETQIRDLKSSHAILFGGQLSNPWVDLYEERLNFHLRTFDEGIGFVNRVPHAGERPSWGDSGSGDDSLTYGRIALLRNVDADSHVLILTGMGMPETDAAAELILKPDFIEDLPAELRTQLNAAPAHLEIIFEANRIGRAVGHRPKVVAWRLTRAQKP